MNAKHLVRSLGDGLTVVVGAAALFILVASYLGSADVPHTSPQRASSLTLSLSLSSTRTGTGHTDLAGRRPLGSDHARMDCAAWSGTRGGSAQHTIRPMKKFICALVLAASACESSPGSSEFPAVAGTYIGTIRVEGRLPDILISQRKTAGRETRSGLGSLAAGRRSSVWSHACLSSTPPRSTAPGWSRPACSGWAPSPRRSLRRAAGAAG